MEGWHEKFVIGQPVKDRKPVTWDIVEGVKLAVWADGQGGFVGGVLIQDDVFSGPRERRFVASSEVREAVNAAICVMRELKEAAVPFKSYPKDDTSPWSFTAADGNALLGNNENWARYKAAHAYVEGGGTPKNKAAYKLPHHKLKNGRMTTFLSGVNAAVRALAGARGGVAIPRSDRPAVIRHLGRHLREFGKDLPPALKREIESSNESRRSLIGTHLWLAEAIGRMKKKAEKATGNG